MTEVGGMRRRLHPLMLAGALVLGLALPALAQGARLHAFGPHPFGPRAGVFGLFLLLRGLLGIGLLLLVWRALLTRSLWSRPDGARQILRERYARGEIAEDEYLKRLGTLA